MTTSSMRSDPQEMERILNPYPAVTSSVICEHGRAKAALLIEAKAPSKTEEDKSARLAETWPLIKLANGKIASSQGQITKDMVLFTSKTEPMLRVGRAQCCATQPQNYTVRTWINFTSSTQRHLNLH